MSSLGCFVSSRCYIACVQTDRLYHHSAAARQITQAASSDSIRSQMLALHLQTFSVPLEWVKKATCLGTAHVQRHGVSAARCFSLQPDPPRQSLPCRRTDKSVQDRPQQPKAILLPVSSKPYTSSARSRCRSRVMLSHAASWAHHQRAAGRQCTRSLHPGAPIL